MGNIKGKHIKAMAEILVRKNPVGFGEDIEANKLKIGEMKLLEYSKKARNELAGEITNLVKRRNHPPAVTAKPRMGSGGRTGFGRGGYGGRDREERSDRYRGRD